MSTLDCPLCHGPTAVKLGYLRMPSGALRRARRLVCQICGASAKRGPVVNGVMQRRVASAGDLALRRVGHGLRDAILSEKRRRDPNYDERVAFDAFYKWLAGELGCTEADAHFGMMNGRRLEDAVLACWGVYDRLPWAPATAASASAAVAEIRARRAA